ncbi:MAG: glycoside hydrolase family 95 protein [Tessaracoccus sp.]|uniref:glycosyl hydrolase family 95 catalytic domain-containing protein n=1 Tax=Tessaracoccus sp. TaxID=1971211 RepID=UPI001EB10E2F|nr:glycoside hydrolase N-terminal domain-containing protein [Tessaracoccus sp.]MBK7819504.1 glycoside hydrolase family 95 protein [Tessaracoccus sp.]
MRHVLRLTRPAEGFIEAFLIGNGRIGAAVHGRPGEELLDLNADTLWSGGPLTPDVAPEAAAVVPALREAIRDRDFDRSERLARQLQSGSWSQSYQPVGALTWRYGTAGGDPFGYARRLDLRDAVATTTSSAGTIHVFASAPDGVIVAHCPEAASAAHPEFVSPHPVRSDRAVDPDGTAWLTVTGRAPAHVAPEYVGLPDAVRYGTDEPDAEGAVVAGMGFAVVVATCATDAGAVLVVAIETGHRGWNRRPLGDVPELAARARDRVRAALQRGAGALRRRHVDDHRALFDAVDLDLSASPATTAHNPALDELAFDVGRYLLIGSSRPGTEAANLQGIWNVDVRPAWSSNYTTNINVEMNYWGAERAGLGALVEPLIALIRDLVDAGADTARRVYGADGSVCHHNTDLWRYTAAVPGETIWANWASCLPWLAAHVAAHAEFGAAPDGFVADTALSLYRPIVRFALAMLVDGADGTLLTSPSTSPEHAFVTPTGRAAVTEGSAMDRELVLELFTGYLDLLDREAATAEDRALRARVEAALHRLPTPAIVDGRIGEWDGVLIGAEPGHRHVSHLYGAFPGRRITRATPDELAAVASSLRDRLSHGGGYTGWSRAWALALAARIGDGTLAEHALSTLTGSLFSASLLDLHPHGKWQGGYVFQIDGNLGAVGGIGELLLQDHDGVLRLLPTLPPSWRAGAVTGLRTRGGHRVDLRWAGGVLVEATIVAGSDGRLAVEADGFADTFDVRAGESYPVWPRD